MEQSDIERRADDSAATKTDKQEKDAIEKDAIEKDAIEREVNNTKKGDESTEHVGESVNQPETTENNVLPVEGDSPVEEGGQQEYNKDVEELTKEENAIEDGAFEQKEGTITTDTDREPTADQTEEPIGDPNVESTVEEGKPKQVIDDGTAANADGMLVTA